MEGLFVKSYTSSSPTKSHPIPKSGETNENDQMVSSPKLPNPSKPAMKHFMEPTISAATKAAAAVPRKRILAERNEAFAFTKAPSQKSQILDSKTSSFNSGFARSISSCYSSGSETDDDQTNLDATKAAAAVPRKKIMAERNEAVTFTKPQSQRTPILDSKISSFNYGVARSIPSCCSSASETDDEQTNSDADSYFEKPYDPLTNYLSPRPRFLRYNPNRRRKIFLNGGNEIQERKGGHAVVDTSTFESQKAVDEEKPSEESSTEQEDVGVDKIEGENNDEDDDLGDEMEVAKDIEVSEETKCCSLKWVLKFLLVMGCLFLSTSYIRTMNSPDTSPVQEILWSFGDGVLQKFQNNMYEVAQRKKFFNSGNEVVDGKDEFAEELITEQDEIDGGLSESTVELGEVVEEPNEKCAAVCNDGTVTKLKVFNTLQGSETADNEFICDPEVLSQVEDSDNQLWGSDVTAHEGAKDQEMEGTRKNFEVRSQVEVSEQLQEVEVAEKSEFCHDDTKLDVSSVHKNDDIIDLKSKDVQMESEEKIKSQKGEGAEKEVVMEIVDDRILNAFDENFIPGMTGSENSEADSRNPEIHLINVHVEAKKTAGLPLAVLFTVLASLGFLYQLRKNRRAKDSLQTETLPPVVEVVSATEDRIINPAIRNVEEEKMEKVESFPSPSSSSIRSMKVASEEFSRHSHAPIVELLGELVIGEEASSSFRSSSGMKNKIQESEEKKNISNSAPTDMMMISRSNARSVHSQGQPSQLELSTADSPSYGSFTAEKKKVVAKKEKLQQEGKSGEASMVTATPVRRSSRIRNRVMSP